MPENIDSATSENVRVVVRVRPLSEKEIASQHKSIIEVDQIGRTISVFNPSCDATEPPKVFSFDAVFGPDSKQLDVYNEAARGIVANVLEGYNGTIFAYGQTGTGKTFTMEGVRETPELKGIIPNSFAHIFGHIAQGNETQKFLVRVSYLEIYNEEVRDLLGKNQTARLEVKERPDVGVYVKDLSTYVVNTADDMDRIMALGNKNRSVGATNMNAHSSRSHAIFSITMEASERREGRHCVHMGKLHLVDLAGSERQSKTGASGQRLKEASKINLSLSTLGNVISALVDGKSTHIPYRNSKLTRLLQDALGGNAKTLMVANVGPAEYNYEETISTLRYANRAKNIKNKAKINEDPKDALLKQFQKEIEDLKRQLQEGSGSEVSGSEEEDGTANSEVKEKTKKKKKKAKQMTEEEQAAIQAKIEFEKQLLIEGANMAEEEKLRVADQLARHKEELSEAQQAEANLRAKLQALEKKVLVGGENLLEKATEQAKLLEEALKELEDRKQTQELLRKQLEEKEAERIDMEERYSSLQEEAVGKTRKLRKVATLLAGAKAEVQDLTREHQREMEALLEGVRHLTRDLRLQSLVIDSFIPHEYQEIIEQHVHWNDDIGEWQLKGVAYAGNNMRKPSSPTPRSAKKYRPEVDLSHVYLSYNDSSVSEPVRLRPKSRMRSASSRRSMHI